MVEKCTGRSKIAAQGMARDGIVEKRKGRLKKYLIYVGFSGGQVSYSRV